MKLHFNTTWMREIAGVLFKLHPLILLLFDQLNTGEAFLTLVVSYLIMALFYTVKMVHAIGYDFMVIQLIKKTTVGARIATAFGHTFGLVIVLIIHLFMYLLFFGLLFDAIQRPMYPNSIFDGESGSILIRTLLINGSWFLGVEIYLFVKYVRNHSVQKNNVMAACFWGVDFTEKNRWRNIRIFWLNLFFMFFILMCTGFAFRLAIISFFIFDLGFLFFQRMQDRFQVVAAQPNSTIQTTSQAVSQSNDPVADRLDRRNP